MLDRPLSKNHWFYHEMPLIQRQFIELPLNQRPARRAPSPPPAQVDHDQGTGMNNKHVDKRLATRFISMLQEYYGGRKAI